uniref:EMS16 B chain n=1 Tax=Echis multisquamatus TaxID=93050 RepID=UPI00001E2D78|nr:Chain B, EMS16 B chain [Echis multisquamatus]1V7P_B Chain B, EMS16 B chain [Echis multisquamatus]
CPLGWSSFDQHCYKVFEPVKNWTEAEEICMQQHKGSRLASIHSSEEEAFVSKLASKALKFTSMWIGLNNPWKDCKWEWSDNARFDYKAWKRRPYCTVMVVKPDRIFWFTRGCEKSVSFVCKFLTDPAV